MRWVAFIAVGALSAAAWLALQSRWNAPGDEPVTARASEPAAATASESVVATPSPRSVAPEQLRGDELGPGAGARPALDIEYADDGGAILRLRAPDGDGDDESGRVVVVVPAGIHPHDVEITMLDGVAEVTWPMAAEHVPAPQMVALPPGMEGLANTVVRSDGVVEVTLPGAHEASPAPPLTFVPHPDAGGQEIFFEASGMVQVPASAPALPVEALPFVLPPGTEADESAVVVAPGIVVIATERVP